MFVAVRIYYNGKQYISLLPATVTLAVLLTMLPCPSSVARHWYSPSSGRWCRECTTFCTSREPLPSCRRRSSTTVLSSTPSLRHVIVGGPATVSDWAWQSSCSTPPRTVTVSWGSWMNVNSTKPPRLDEEEEEEDEEVSEAVGGKEKRTSETEAQKHETISRPVIYWWCLNNLVDIHA